MRSAVDPAQSRYGAGNQCWEVPNTDPVHLGQAPAWAAEQQDPWQPRCKGVRRRHSLGSRGTNQVSSDREDVPILEAEARGYGVPGSSRGRACSSASEGGRRHAAVEEEEGEIARQGR